MYEKHKIYAKIFNVLRKFPQKNNKITLLTNKNHSFEANLEYIAKELDNRNNNGKNYEYKFIPKDSLSFANIRDFASSKYVFLVDNFFPLAFMNVEGMKWVQLWHGTGLFKKFGGDRLISLNPEYAEEQNIYATWRADYAWIPFEKLQGLTGEGA